MCLIKRQVHIPSKGKYLKHENTGEKIKQRKARGNWTENKRKRGQRAAGARGTQQLFSVKYLLGDANENLMKITATFDVAMLNAV